jgi:hypothetical protein
MKKIRMNKYHATKTTLDGIKFDSKCESRRYSELLLLVRGKVIKDLELQPEFTLQLPFTDAMGVKHRGITYRADFRYKEKGKMIVEDVKGMLTEVYKIKKKLFLYAFRDVEFREV